MNTISRPYVTHQPKLSQVQFQGELRNLVPFCKNGITPMSDDAFYSNRDELDPRLQINALINTKNRQPLILLGPPQSGKSMVLGGLAKQLRDHGYSVYTIEQRIKPNPHYLTKDNVQDLENQITTEEAKHPKKPVFLFIDEFQYTMGGSKEPVLFDLYALLKNHPQVQLIATAQQQGWEFYSRHGQGWLFPEECHIVLPAPQALPREKIIDMANRNLHQAGYKPIPQAVQEDLRKLDIPLLPRHLINAIWKILKMDASYQDQPNHIQAIPNTAWQNLITQYRQIYQRNPLKET